MTDVNTLYNEAESLKDDGQPEQAIAKLQELLQQDPFNFTALSVTYQRAWQGTQKPEYIQLAEDAMARAHSLQG